MQALISSGPSALLYSQQHPYLAFPAILAGDFLPRLQSCKLRSIKLRLLLAPPPNQDMLGKYPNVDGQATQFEAMGKSRITEIDTCLVSMPEICKNPPRGRHWLKNKYKILNHMA
jgi:hypothetical protein